MSYDFTSKMKKIEDVLNSFLPEEYYSEWINSNFSYLPKSVNSVHFDQLVKPCRNLVCLGGKRWRPLFMVLCSELELQKYSFLESCNTTQRKIFEKKVELAYKLTPIVEMVHTASLIHDDIEDGADVRRGQPAAHITYGLDRSINAASWLYFASFSAIESNVQDLTLKNTLNSLLLSELRRLHLGQAMDIYWHKNPDIIPSHSEYSSMVRMKTGTLASLSAQAGVLCAGGSMQNAKQLGELASKIGEGFQVLDDVINITTGNKGKKRGDDIIEGKKSLPLIFHLEEKPEDTGMLLENFSIASRDGIESPVIEQTIQILNTSNAISRAKKYSDNLIKDCCKKIIELYNGSEASLQIENLFCSML